MPAVHLQNMRLNGNTGPDGISRTIPLGRFKDGGRTTVELEESRLLGSSFMVMKQAAELGG